MDRYLALLARHACSAQPLDVLEVNLCFGVDVITAFTFGLPNASNLVEDLNERDEWLKMYLDSHPPASLFWLVEFPTLTAAICRLFPAFLPSSYNRGRREFERWTLEKIDASEPAASMIDYEELPPGEAPILYGQIRRSLVGQSKKLACLGTAAALSPASKLNAASECLDHISEFPQISFIGRE